MESELLNNFNVLNPTLSVRLSALENVREISMEKEGVIRRICRDVIYSLVAIHYTEKRWTRACIDFIAYAVNLPLSFDCMAFCLEVLNNRLTRVSRGEQLCVIIEITVAMLQARADSCAPASPIESETCAPAVVLVGKAMDKLATASKERKNYVSRGARAACALLVRHPAYIPVCVDVWSASSPTHSISALSLVLSNPILSRHLSAAPLMHQALQKLLTAPKPPAPGLLDCLSTFVQSLSQQEWTETYSPILSKLIKKSPENSAQMVATLCSAVQVDLTQLTSETLCTTAPRMLKSANYITREAACVIVKEVANKCADPAAFCSLLTALLESLQGKTPGATLTQTYQKAATVDAIRSCFRSIKKFQGQRTEEVSQATETAMIVLLGCFEKEPDEDIRCSEALTATQCLLTRQTISTKIISAISQGLTKKKIGTSVSPLLLMLHALFQRPVSGNIDEYCSALVSSIEIVSSLASTIKDAIKKPQVASPDAVLALHILLELKAQVGLPDDTLDWSKIPSLSTSESFLSCPALQNFLFSSYSAASSRETYGVRRMCGEVVIALSAVVTMTQRDMCASAHPGVKPLTAGIMGFCILFPGRDTASGVNYWVGEMLNSAPGASTCMLEWLYASLHAATVDKEDNELQTRRSLKGPEGSSNTGRPSDRMHLAYLPPSRLRAAVHVCLPRTVHSPTCSASVFSRILVLSAHPNISNSFSQSISMFRNISQRFDFSLDSALSDHLYADELSVFLQEAALNSASQSTRKAGSGALALLHNTDLKSAHAIVLSTVSRIVGTLGDNDISTLSDEEVEVYQNPQYLIDKAITVVNAEDIKITNADRKKSSARGTRRGMFGSDFTEDEDWAEQVRREKARKLMETKGENSPEVEEARSRTADILSRVQATLSSSLHALSCLSHMAELCSAAVADVCHMIIQPLLTLVRSKLVGQEATLCLEVLVMNLVDKSLAHCKRDIVNALRLVALILQEPVSKQMPEEHIYARAVEVAPAFSGVVRELHVLAARSITPTPACFHMIFPLLKGVLSLRALIPGCEQAFMVLERFWSAMDMDASSSARPLLRPLLETCLTAMARYRVTPAPEKVLLRMVSAVPLSPMEWSPMLGAHGLLHHEVHVRLACLRALHHAVECGMSESMNRNPLLVSRVWLVCYDLEEEVRTLAVEVWQKSGMVQREAFMTSLVPLFSHEATHVAMSAARAVAGGMTLYPHLCRECVETLCTIFTEAMPVKEAPPRAIAPTGSGAVASLMMRAPVKKTEDVTFPCRVAVAASFEEIGNTMALVKAHDTEELVQDVITFVLSEGVTDEHPSVRERMLAAGRAVIDTYGVDYCDGIIATLEHTLRQEQQEGEEAARFDHRHEAAVILLGAAGKHLKSDDPSMMGILESLVVALNTPVGSIQRAVADCLVPLVQGLKSDERVKTMLESIINQTLNAETYGERRGAAYGLSAFVKGMGIPSIKNHDIVNRLKDACSSGSINNRQGALFAFELLSERLGMLFEPYVITIVPILLKCFSHSSDHVREASQMAAKVIMAKLSAHGVKQVLTPILSSLPTETAWKSKQEALRLLGTMAFCAPRQLSTSLPQIIPRLVEAGSDPHPKVKDAAKKALTDITSVIRNPEVSSLSGVLIGALTDPSNKTKSALEALLECEFMHSIDAPSLAILVPILARALRDRGGDLKRKSAVIIGNMCSMINDPKIIVPYLPQVVPGLQSVLMDPIPDVRATSAKALGSLMAGVGEQELSDLIPWLMCALKDDTSPVERSGAAQGLAEMCLSLEENRVDEIVQDALNLQRSPKASAREGLLWLLTFLPSVVGEIFAVYIGHTLPVVLAGLSDDSEGVREVALRAGQVFVHAHGRNHTHDVVNPLLSGMFDDDWRIRESSVTLLGELLYLIGETKAVGLTDNENDDEDGNAGGLGSSSRVVTTIRAHVGEELADTILASLYMVRSDGSVTVRQGALQVWKSVVSNTPRTLREVMPSLVELLIRKLSSQSDDHRTVAGRCLGDLVRKLGDHVLPLVVPYLQRGLGSSDDELRQGVCLGLSEILRAATQKQVETYVDTLVPALQQALCDDSDHVRTLAAQAFHALMKAIGERATASVVPSLLARVKDEYDPMRPEEIGSALRGLRSIVMHKPRDLLEYLLPVLLSHPIHPHSAGALGVICESAGAALHHHFSFLIPQLVDELVVMDEKIAEVSDDDAKATFEVLRHSVGAIVGATSTQGVNYLVGELGKQIEHETDFRRRKWGCIITADFFRRCKSDYAEYVPVLLKYLLSRSADAEKGVLEGVLEALRALAAAVSVDELSSHMDFVRSCISLTASDAKHRSGRANLIAQDGTVLLPLFRLPKALDPLLPIFIHCLMNGSPDSRECAADGIGELMTMTETALLKPYLIKTTGPLIRVVGDRYPSNVKYAILQTLCILLQKGGVGLKAFVPQLQTTFVKSLSDPAKQVRSKGAHALGMLVPMSTRVDPLLNELSSSSHQAESNAIRASMLQALAQVIHAGGGKASEGALVKVSQTVLQCLVADEEQVRQSASECVSSLAVVLTEDGVCDLLQDIVDLDSSSGAVWAPAAGKVLGCAAVLRSGGSRTSRARGQAFDLVDASLADDRVAVRVAACSSLAMAVAPPSLTTGCPEATSEHKDLSAALITSFTPKVLACVRGEALEVRRAAVTTLKEFAKHHPSVLLPFSAQIGSELYPFLSTNEINIRLKRHAERTMKYIMGISYHSNLDSELFQTTLATIQAAGNAELARFLRDYAKRMLNKLADESDDNMW